MTATHRSENDSKPQGADPFGHEEIEVVNKQQHVEDAVQYDEAEARRILRKVDYRVVPLLIIMYLTAFIDRANIGNAKIAGMNDELELTGRQYNIVLTVFFIPYAILEVPSNIILKLTRPSIWLPSIMLACGIVLTLMGIVQNFTGLTIARVFLGIPEAGFFPGATYLLTTWYLRIFILEGIATVLVAVWLYFVLPDGPETAKFLTPEERRFLAWRMQAEMGINSDQAHEEKLDFQTVKSGLNDWRIYVAVIIFLANSVGIYAFSFTVPTVILELGYTAATAQLLTIPIYVCAMILATTLAALPDRYKKRFPFLMVGLGVAAAGLISLLAIPRPVDHVDIGNNLSPSSKRAVGMAVFMSLGNLGGIAGSNIFPEEEKPQYRTGYGCMQEDDGRFGYVSALLVEQLRSTPVRQVNIYISTDEVIRSQIGRPLLFNRSAKDLATEIENTAPDWSKRQEKVHLATNLDTFSAGLHDWVFFETRRRTKLVAYSFFNLHSIAYNIPPKLLNSEIGALNLPSPESHWRAETAEQWLAARKKDTFDEVSVQSAYKNLSTKANGRQSPALSSFGNYILIHRLVQQIFFARQSMILFDADDDAPLPPQAMERLESALCAWQRNWEATKDSSLDPLAPGGPLSFNATALFKLAYIRLHTDLGPYRRLETRDPGAIAQAFCTAPLLQRSTGVNRAVLHSAHSLSIPVRIGIEFVARTQTLHWSIVHSLCNLECGLFLAKWLQTIAHALAFFTSSRYRTVKDICAPSALT
ncbi:hypothetical protein AU210_000120 [Fusarium oxysporum f. sp. radicis-cucumerinum]|uniref:Major facilitator superfamily (MFS) profile domain-containing protein n=1 Tax=Fusarium oxysporum f. sp. radicis-cucumerinum TaxID=327505 RepID=A0A2H3HZ61_FUSOX|nr:hypothetical protein AU210_000120 [Fusarium oxysporum f. sp. radicis-cucumerinum]